MNGQTRPALAKTQLLVQRRVIRTTRTGRRMVRWTTLRRVRTTTSGRFRFVYRARKLGRDTLRVRVTSSSSRLPSTSGQLRLNVTRRERSRWPRPGARPFRAAPGPAGAAGVATIDGIADQIAPIGRPREAARASYDRIAPAYDVLEGAFEGPARHRGLRALAAADGERVLEIGFGTGHALARIADAVGPSGGVVGIDISPRMRDVAERRLTRAGLSGRAELIVGDALEQDLDGPFDAAFMSFALELLEEDDMLALLGAIRDALRPGGRLAVVAMATPEGRPGALSRLYSWSHRRMPAVVDCRPIPVTDLLERAGFEVQGTLRGSLFGIPYAIAGGVRPST